VRHEANLTVLVESSVAAVDLVRPWRTATVIAVGVAVVELIVILVAGVALLAKPVAKQVQSAAAARDPLAVRPKPPPPRAAREAADTPVLPRDETSVLVLNGNGRTGAAADAASRLHRVGYIVGGVGNAPRPDYGRSVVMYRPGYRREALRLGRDLKIKIVGPLDGLRLKQLFGAHLALVVGN
jgi:LytR cell envelope-related transcriptional attenuator